MVARVTVECDPQAHNDVGVTMVYHAEQAAGDVHVIVDPTIVLLPGKAFRVELAAHRAARVHPLAPEALGNSCVGVRLVSDRCSGRITATLVTTRVSEAGSSRLETDYVAYLGPMQIVDLKINAAQTLVLRETPTPQENADDR